jgi:hypothetical protein
MSRIEDEKILFLDDDVRRMKAFRRVHPRAVWVQTARECIKRILLPWDVISLDHDLGGETYVDPQRKDCGMEVVRYILRNRPACLAQTRFIVHSRNQFAAVMMAEALSSAGYQCDLEPFINQMAA